MAASESVSGRVTISVTPVPAASITLSAAVSMVPRATQRLVATVRDSAGTVLTGRSVIWSSSNVTTATVSDSGVVTAVSAGTVRITASAESRSAAVDIVVRDGGLIVPSGGTASGLAGAVLLTVPAASVSAPLSLTVDRDTVAPPHPRLLSDRAFRIAPETTTFAQPAILRVSYASLPAGVRATQLRVHWWDGAAWQPLAGSVDTVSARVTAELRRGGPFALIETPLPVGSVVVTPDRAELSIGDSLRLQASVRALDGTPLTDRNVTWRSSNPALATVSATGVVTAVAAGAEVLISAVSEGKGDTARITVAEPFAFTAIYTGAFHTCALSNRGEAWCWGSNASCELGIASCGGSRPSPQRVVTALRFSSLALGQDYTCGVTTDGAAWCWGRSDRGNLGTTASGASATPTAVSGGLRFTQLSAGYRHVCGLDASGVAWCWGANNDGQLGIGSDEAQRSTPSRVLGNHVFASIGTGSEHSCGLTTEGVAWCWGENSDGESGNGTGTDVSQPVRVSGGRVFTSLSVGEFHSCGLVADGALWCWGWNESGQVGDGSTSSRLVPVAVSGDDRFASVRAFGWSTCALTTGGAAQCWGENFEGQLGIGATGDRSTPVSVSGSHTFRSLSVGGLAYHMCGVTTGDVWYCWGWSNNGQIGDGAYVDRRVPTALPIPSGALRATRVQSRR